ncbi:hypothetical protein [Undibacterium sp. Ren11W]|uniref:hypothetical protein n=1 Tax=Undibacterium sp. Ren11W TaxID=3413045 RepID=UPI003BF27C54
MKKMIKNTVVGAALLVTLSLAQAQAPKAAVDISMDGIFTALTSSNDLQYTVDTLIAHGANLHTVVSIAAAAGIPQNKVQDLQVCVNEISPDVKVLSATCLRPRSVQTAYAAGMNDPLNYLPATAAGKR